MLCHEQTEEPYECVSGESADLSGDDYAPSAVPADPVGAQKRLYAADSGHRTALLQKQAGRGSRRRAAHRPAGGNPTIETGKPAAVAQSAFQTGAPALFPGCPVQVVVVVCTHLPAGCHAERPALWQPAHRCRDRQPVCGRTVSPAHSPQNRLSGAGIGSAASVHSQPAGGQSISCGCCMAMAYGQAPGRKGTVEGGRLCSIPLTA